MVNAKLLNADVRTARAVKFKSILAPPIKCGWPTQSIEAVPALDTASTHRCSSCADLVAYFPSNLIFYYLDYSVFFR